MTKRAVGALLFVLVLVSLAVVFIPAWTIHPFKPQTARGVELAYTLRRWAPWVTALAALLSLGLAVRLWRGARWWWRTVLVLALVPVAAAAWFSRQNPFEWMFAPISGTAHAVAGEAGWVEEGDMVLAIEVNGEAVAYPVRQIAYHHIVQDVVGGEPVAATY
jgi:hypothetical protein